MTSVDRSERDCPLCERPMFHASDHHLVPKSRGGKRTALICSDCHSAIHALFTNKELERDYETVGSLLSDPRFCRALAFIKKQDPRRRYRSVRSAGRRRGRAG